MIGIAKSRLLALALPCMAGLLSPSAIADDIDLFIGPHADAAAPNVLIVLDNTSNWARQSQQWPGGIQQGQAEANAIKTVLQSLDSTINVGLMEFVTNGNANDNGGVVRYAIKPMSDANKTVFSTKLTTIYNNITSVTEKRNSNTPYGNLMYDVYNYFAGGSVSADGNNGTQSLNPPNDDTDSSGYTANYSKFLSPLLNSGICAKNFVIFIGNPNASGPSSDASANTSALSDAGGDTSQLPLPNFTTGGVPANTTLGTTAQCYASLSDANTAYGYGVVVNEDRNQLYVNTATANDYKTLCSTYTQGCSIGSAAATSSLQCASGTQRYTVIQTANSTTTTQQTPVQTSAISSTCYASSSAAAIGVSGSDHAGLTCPATTTSTVNGVTTTTSHSCTYTLGAVDSNCSSTSVATTGTSACYTAFSSVSGTDTGGLTCPSNYTCTYAASNTPTTCAAGANVTSTAATTSCYTAANATGSDHGSLSCPSGYTCAYSTGAAASTCSTPSTSAGTTTSYYSSSPAITTTSGTITAPATSPALTCPTGYTCTYSAAPRNTLGTQTSAYSSSCYTSAPSFTNPSTSSSVSTQTALTCPADAQCTYTAVAASDSSIKDANNKNCGATGSTGPGSIYIVTQTVSSTKYTITQTPDSSTHSHYTITQTATPIPTYKYPITQTAIPPGTARYNVIQTDTPTVTVTQPTQTALGYTSLCYATPPSSSTGDFASQCSGNGISCTYGNSPTTTTTSCSVGTSQYQVIGTNLVLSMVATGTTSADTGPRNADEWARFLYTTGVPAADGSRRLISTYTIDVYNKQPNAVQTALLTNMANYGGGRYFAARSEAEIVTDLKKILMEIQSVNSTFASASLPVNATNRSQNQNQVFIGMFRPDPDARPRWFGNLKQYQLIKDTDGSLQLGDKAGNRAVNLQTGFVDDCATSFWTTDSDSYWSGITVKPALKKACTTASAASVYSDAPDGSFVEKGGVAEVIRLGNTVTTDMTVQRTIYTESSGSLSALDSSSSASLVNRFTAGYDVTNELNLATFDASTTTRVRPSVHGDVIHSRPLPVNYGGNTGVVVYYGANDGLLRAVSAPANATDSAKEKWAFLAAESTTAQLTRLMNNDPNVKFYGSVDATATPKDYFFDGSFGLFQNLAGADGSMASATNAKVWLYPSLRRGGRMIYGLDVTDPERPAFLWKAGCPNQSNDDNCAYGDASTGISGIGQTWSMPSATLVKGVDVANNQTSATPTNSMIPVVIFGGGYDACEDTNTSTVNNSGTTDTNCPATKGKAVYILNGQTGAPLKVFTTDAPVVADVALIDVNNDGRADYAYVADIGGNLYRIDFVDGSTTSYYSLPASKWKMRKIAYTSGGGRKFLYPPALFNNGTKVYVALGSGDREHPLISQYPYTTPVTNRFYVYVDDLRVKITEAVNGDNGSTSTAATTDIPAADNLDSSVTLANYSGTTTCDTSKITPSSSKKGWYMDFPYQGEQTVTSAVIAGGMVTFSTNRPLPVSDNACTNTLGEARGYWLNLFNASGAIGANGDTCGGTRATAFVGGGLPPSPVIASVPINGKQETVVIGAVSLTGNASSPIAPQQVKPRLSSKRKAVYWKSSSDN